MVDWENKWTVGLGNGAWGKKESWGRVVVTPNHESRNGRKAGDSSMNWSNML